MEGFYAHPEYYDILFDWDRSHEIEFIHSSLIHYGISEGSTILEIACGTGLASIPMAEKDWKVICLDLSSSMLDYLKNKAPLNLKSKLTPLQADMKEFVISQKVKAAFCTIGSIGLLDTDHDFVQHLKSVSSNLTQDGIYIIDVGIHEKETTKSDYHSIEWSCERDGIFVEAYQGKVYINEPEKEEQILDWEAIPYEYQYDHLVKLIKESQCFEILAWHEEKELTDEGVSLFNLNHTVDKPTKRSMLILKKL